MAETHEFKSNFEGRSDLIYEYGNNSLLLYTLQLKYHIEDIKTIAEDTLVDGSDDKKCDLIYIDRDQGIGIIAQGYFSETWGKQKAPANKASDLNTAVSWALSRKISAVPDQIKSAVELLRDAIIKDEISTLEFWYVHNCYESKEVLDELISVKESANSILNTNYHGKNVNIAVYEYGLDSINKLYNEIQTPISVSDNLEINVQNGYEIRIGTDWAAYSTAVRASWIYEIYQKYEKRLFSANYRDYLGSRKSNLNINNDIKTTAENTPENFWVYNNGITALVNDYTIRKSGNKNIILIKGISIVNGAQTTGAIGSLPNKPDEKAEISIRFVKSNNNEIIQNIVRYNNSQNRLNPADYRSTDNIQVKLRKEFKDIENFEYLGGRRGGNEDIIRRIPNLIPSDTVAQSLMAFHSDPIIAYNSKKKVWNDDNNYNKIFKNETTAYHIIFVYSLSKAISEYKHNLKNKELSEELTETEEKILNFLRFRGSVPLYTHAIGAIVDEINGRRIPNKFDLKFKNNSNLETCIEQWTPILECTIAYSDQLLPAVESGLNSLKKVESSVGQFKNVIYSTKSANKEIYSTFSEKILSI